MTGHQLLSGTHTHTHREGRQGREVEKWWWCLITGKPTPTQILSPSHQDSQGTILSVSATPHPVNTAARSRKLQENMLQ